MFTRIRRIIFVAILAFIIYWIYRLIDRNSATELKDNVVDKTQETASNVNSGIKENFDYLFDWNKESLDDSTLTTSWKNIVISDPEIVGPTWYVSDKIATWINQEIPSEKDSSPTNYEASNTNSQTCTTQTTCTGNLATGTIQNTGTSSPSTGKVTTTKTTTPKATTTTTTKKPSSSYYNILYQLFK